jgi:hypothetical protein
MFRQTQGGFFATNPTIKMRRGAVAIAILAMKQSAWDVRSWL